VPVVPVKVKLVIAWDNSSASYSDKDEQVEDVSDTAAEEVSERVPLRDKSSSKARAPTEFGAGGGTGWVSFFPTIKSAQLKPIDKGEISLCSAGDEESAEDEEVEDWNDKGPVEEAKTPVIPGEEDLWGRWRGWYNPGVTEGCDKGPDEGNETGDCEVAWGNHWLNKELVEDEADEDPLKGGGSGSGGNGAGIVPENGLREGPFIFKYYYINKHLKHKTGIKII